VRARSVKCDCHGYWKEVNPIVMNNPIWLMTSAFPSRSLDQIIETAQDIGVQGMELCVFRKESERDDHVAKHLEYEGFGKDEADRLIERCQREGLRFSISAYENLIGGTLKERVKNQNHLLKLIRIAHLLGGDQNDITVGTFVGYNHELGVLDNGFERNLDEYVRVFAPIISYAEDLGVTITYENCPMEGWMPSTTATTYNNLPATLAARKLMYTLIPSAAHGETYDPSHDVWQHIDPVEVIKSSDMSRIRRVHVKGTRHRQNQASIHWGALYPMQSVDPELAQKAGIPIPANAWDRHHYEPTLPGFGGSDSMDWRAFLETLMQRDYQGPFVIENEALHSAHTGNPGAITQGFQSAVLSLAPVIWPLRDGVGYQYDAANSNPLNPAATQDIPVVSMDMF